MDRPSVKIGDTIALNYIEKEVSLFDYLCKKEEQTYSNVQIRPLDTQHDFIPAPLLIGGFRSRITEISIDDDGCTKAYTPDLSIHVENALDSGEVEIIDKPGITPKEIQNDYQKLIDEIKEHHRMYEDGFITMIEMNNKILAPLASFYDKIDSHNNPMILEDKKRNNPKHLTREGYCLRSWTHLQQSFKQNKGRIGIIIRKQDYKEELNQLVLDFFLEMQNRGIDKYLHISLYMSGFWLTRPMVSDKTKNCNTRINIQSRHVDISPPKTEMPNQFYFDITLYEEGQVKYQLQSSAPWNDVHFVDMLDSVIDQET